MSVSPYVTNFELISIGQTVTFLFFLISTIVFYVQSQLLGTICIIIHIYIYDYVSDCLVQVREIFQSIVLNKLEFHFEKLVRMIRILNIVNI